MHARQAQLVRPDRAARATARRRAALGLPRSAGAWLLALPCSWLSVAVAAAMMALAVPRLYGAVGGGVLKYLPILGMALGLADAARSPDRRAQGVLGFCLNILALIAWAVVSVILRATRPDGL